ncbi:MAG: MOSC N-terminal beta barrel domain-containing protein [Solirubrobacterales bacterium]|nr:MOSC N-terminal beta barrel domain-containing protein [Solirubrobacterales bacterium]
MKVAELWRFPVKSLGGERLESVAVSDGGIEGDRGFAIFDRVSGLGLTARRVPELLFATARLRGDGSLEIVAADGSRIGTDEASLSSWLGRPVELRDASKTGVRRYENTTDPEHEETAPWQAFEGAGGRFHDSPRARVSLVSTGTIGEWDRRRFRSNVLITGEGEDALVGGRLAVGTAILSVGMAISRCVMVTRPQPGGVERDIDVLGRIARERDGRLAVGALVEQPGTVCVGDSIEPA